MADVVSIGTGDLWYRKNTIDGAIEHILYLSYKPKAQAYSVNVGVISPYIRTVLFGKKELLLECMAPIYAADVNYFNKPCWQVFNAGRALDWPSVYVLPDPLNQDGWGQQVDELFLKFIEPNFGAVNDICGIKKILLRDSPPFEWSITNVILRAAEIVAIGAAAKIDMAVLEAELIYFKEYISKAQQKFSYEDIIERLFDIFY